MNLVNLSKEPAGWYQVYIFVDETCEALHYLIFQNLMVYPPAQFIHSLAG